MSRYLVRWTTSLVAAALAGALVSGVAFAQQSTQPAPAPGATMTQDGKAKATVEERADRKAVQKRAAARKTAAEKKAEPSAAASTWDKTKAMTRAQWNKAKKAWAQEKDKWNDCNAQARKDKLSGTKRWSFISSCMTK